MRRTRHVVLPVRSWQYIGLLLVSLACVTFGLVARDREGQAGSLTGPELLHRAPHDVDVCPNLNPFAKFSVCLDLPENQDFDLKTDERKKGNSDIVRIDKKSIEFDINRNELPQRSYRTINERRISERSSYPMKKFSHLSRRYSNDRSRSIERHEEHGNEQKTERRNFGKLELKERRHRLEIDTRRMIDSRSIERKEARGRLRENIEDRTIRENRKNVRERIQDRRSNSVERREFRIEDLERRLMKERRINEHRNSRINISDRRSKLGTELVSFSRGRQLNIDVERRNSPIDIMNSEHRLSVNAEHRNSLINNLNRQRGSSISQERKNSPLNIVNRESQSSVDIGRRHSRFDALNREHRLSVDGERRNSRVDTANRERQSNSITEHRNFQSDTFNHKRPMKSVDIEERKNSRLDIYKRDRRFSIDAERKNSKLNISNRERRQNLDEERRNSRLNTLNRQRRMSVDTERRNSRLDNLNRQRTSSLSTERRNSQLYSVNQERQSNDDVERRNSRLDALNRERGSSVNVERRNSRLDNLNRQRRSSLSTERRNSQLYTVNRERQSNDDVERRNSRLDALNRERRLSVDAERRNSRLDNLNRQRRSSLSTERRNSQLYTVNRERQSNDDVERRNSRLDALNRERLSSVNVERRNSRLDNLNRQRRSSLNTERRNSQLYTVNQERQPNDDVEHRNSRLDALNRKRRMSVDAERRISRLDNLNQRRSSLSTERRNSQLYSVNRERQSNDDVERRNSRLDALKHERRSSVDAERRNSRLDNLNRQRRSSLSTERRNSQLYTVNRESQSNDDVERRISRLDTINHERRSSSLDRTSTRIIGENRHDSKSINSNSQRIKKSTSRDNTPVDQRHIRRENIRSEIRNIRFNSFERKQSENKLDQRFGRRSVDLEDHKLLDRRSRSIEQRKINALNRDNAYITFTKRDSRGEIVRTRANRSSDSIDHHEQRKIFLNRGIIKSPKLSHREVNALRHIVRSFNAENLRNTLPTARYSFDSSLQLDRTRIERNSFSNERLNGRSTRRQIADEVSLPERREIQNRQRRIARIFTPEISNRKSFITQKFHVSKQAERLSRSFDNINRLNSNERREFVENRRFRTNNDHSYSVLSTKRQNIQQQRENLPRTSILVLTNNFEERRLLDTRIQERNNGRIERMMNEKRRSNDSRLIGKEERLMVLRSRDHRRNIRSNLKKRYNDSQIRYIDSLTRRENSDLERTFKLIERSRSNADKRSSYRKLTDFRQSNSLREKIRTSETSTQHRNMLLIPMIDHDRLNVAKNKENTRQFLDINHKTQKIFKEFRNEEYGGKIGIISNLLKTNIFLDYNLSFEIIRQPFMIIICILYGSSMSKNNKFFTGNLMERITRLVLR